MTAERSAADWRAEGLASYEAGRWDEAASALERALSLDPDSADAWYRLGNARQELELHLAAMECFERVVALDPGHAQAWNNLGNSHEQLGHDSLAAEAYRRALVQDPSLLQALINLSNLCLRLGDLVEAAPLLERAASLNPDIRAELERRSQAARPHLAEAEAALGRGDQAAARNGLASALKLLPANPILVHMLTATRGETTTGPPPGYVAALFDGFAETYDRQMVEVLEYRAPAALAEVVLPELRRIHPARVVDLGCGTGFMGTALASAQAEILGVDLSQRMLDRAAQRGAYARLVRGDLVEELGRLPAASMHAVVAADVFVYLGDLRAVFAASARTLVRGGLFAFSVEALERGEYQLRMNGRYAHSSAYLRALAVDCGFVERRLESFCPRRERDRHIEGWLACFTASS